MINKLVLLFALLAMVTIGIEARLLDLSSLEKLARVTRGKLFLSKNKARKPFLRSSRR